VYTHQELAIINSMSTLITTPTCIFVYKF